MTDDPVTTTAAAHLRRSYRRSAVEVTADRLIDHATRLSVFTPHERDAIGVVINALRRIADDD